MERSASSSRRRLTATLGIAGLVLAAIVGLSYRQWEQYRRANSEAERSRETLAAINNVLTSLLEAETGERGFLLTGEDRYLEPYDRALQQLPIDLATVKGLLGGDQRATQEFDELNTLANSREDQLRQRVELRRTQGAQAALAIVLTDEGKGTMDSIRALCAQMGRDEDARHARASASGEAAAGIALLITVAGSLALFFLFALGFEPFASPDPLAWRRSRLLRYGAAILAVVAVTLIRAALTPLMGPIAMPFTLYFCAVAIAAWFGGFRPAVLSVALSLLAGDWFFASPTGTLRISGHDDQVASLLLVLVGFGIALLSRSQRGAVDRALSAESSERNERQRFETTLASIGDAVIATDGEGRVTFANKVALSLMRRTESEIAGKPLDSVFQIVNEFTREKVESPVDRVLREGRIVGLANHTVLIAQDGTEVPIDDSASPLRGSDGTVHGAVLVFRDITERRRAEATSRLLSSIVESSEDAIISKDANGVITSWNRGAEHVFGYSAGEMIGKPIAMLAPADRHDEMHEILERIRRGEHVEHYRAVRRTKSGALIHVSVSVSPIRDAGGRIVGASEIARNVSDQVEAQSELAAERERLGGIIDSAMDAIVTVDQSQRIKVFNHAAEQVFRCSTAEALEQSLDTFIPERFRSAHHNHIEQFGKSGTTTRSMSRPGVLWGRRRNGEEFPLEASISQIERDGEKLFTVILRDITERKRIEDELHRERERLGLALTAGKMGVYEMDLTRDTLWLSAESYSLLGTTPHGLGASPELLVRLVHPNDRELLLQHIKESIEAHEPINHEFRILRPDGKESWISCQGQIEYDEERHAVRHSGVLVDITSRKQSERMLRKWEKLAAAARLSAAMAHEINNPLGAAVNLIYLVKNVPGLSPDAGQMLLQAEHELERVAHATRQTLGFYRESNLPEPIDVPALIESVLELYSTKLISKHISIERVFAECVPVQGVRGEVRQVVSNVIANAIDAVAKGGVIVIGVQSVPGDKDGAAEIVVADNGPGIAVGDVDKVFEPFFTTKGGTQTGLGLWVTKDIVERHGGTITVSSKEEGSELRGATVTIRLPRTPRLRRGEQETSIAVPSNGDLAILDPEDSGKSR